MTCPRLRHGPSEFDEGPPAHSEAGSSLTCAKHTFMWSTCQASKIRRLTRPGIPGLEKRETLRQAQGRLWGTPVFPVSTLKTSRVIARPRCWPPASNRETREVSHSPSTASGRAAMPSQNDPCHELSCLESAAIALRVIDSHPLVGCIECDTLFW